MKLHLLSDLHLESETFDPVDVDADLVVLAGDIAEGVNGLRWAMESIPDIPVVYVIGNHEYHRHSFPSLIGELKEIAEGSHVHVLENDSVEMGGWRIFGATLWTDLLLCGTRLRESTAISGIISDYRLVTDSRTHKKLHQEATIEAHTASLAALTAFLESGAPDRSIVVTHHLPTDRSISEKFKGKKANAIFASNLDTLIEQYQPALWIHGHSHHAVDYHIGRTRIVSNPRGYVQKEPDTGFDPRKIITLG